jgi:sulfite reductase (NADPH) flavoprotein alpha-component
MVVFLMFTASGVYWAFDPIRDMADGWMGTCVRRAKRRGQAESAQAIESRSGRYVGELGNLQAQCAGLADGGLRPPERATQPLQILWVAKDAP